MVKAGGPTEAVINELAPLLEPGDSVVDGGNAHFEDTRRREAKLREHGLHFVGTGMSGGEVGALDGPSIMPGGSRESYAALGPILESIAALVGGEPCSDRPILTGPGRAIVLADRQQFVDDVRDALWASKVVAIRWA